MLIIIYIFAVIAIIASVLTIVLSVILIVSKKANSRQMDKITFAAVVSALTAPLMAAAWMFLSIYSTTDLISWDYRIPDLTGLPYEECKIAFVSFIDLSVSDMEYSSEYPEGAIISQSLESGTYQMPTPHYVFSMQCVVSKGAEADSSEKGADTDD